MCYTRESMPILSILFGGFPSPEVERQWRGLESSRMHTAAQIRSDITHPAQPLTAAGIAAAVARGLMAAPNLVRIASLNAHTASLTAPQLPHTACHTLNRHTLNHHTLNRLTALHGCTAPMQPAHLLTAPGICCGGCCGGCSAGEIWCVAAAAAATEGYRDPGGVTTLGAAGFWVLPVVAAAKAGGGAGGADSAS